jgi:hypothetical protein
MDYSVGSRIRVKLYIAFGASALKVDETQIIRVL